MIVRKNIIYTIVKFLCTLIYPFIRFNNTFLSHPKLRIIVYHSICLTETEDDDWNVTPELFEAQINFLAKNKYVILTVENVVDHLKSGQDFPPKAVCITFDDGFRNNYVYAYPILLHHNIKATFYIVTRFIGTDKPFSWVTNFESSSEKVKKSLRFQPLRWEEVKEMSQNGMKFGSHSDSHTNFASMDDSAIRKELIESIQTLKARLNIAKTSFTAPWGVWGALTKRLKTILRTNNYSGAILGRWGAVRPKGDYFDLPRIIIYGRDTLKIFKHKINGAYDWIGWIHSLWHNTRTIVDSFQETRKEKE